MTLCFIEAKLPQNVSIYVYVYIYTKSPRPRVKDGRMLSIRSCAQDSMASPKTRSMNSSMLGILKIGSWRC